MVEIRTVGLCKKFGRVVAVDHLDLEIQNGTLVTLLGPSGCGKTTALRMIAGFLEPDAGKVYFENTDVTHLPAHKRNVGFLFQRIALFPHMNVHDNVEFGLKMMKYPKEDRENKINQVLKLLHMDGYEKRKHTELSGGEQQRVALARVLVLDPDILLLDEPLSSIDAKLRDELKYEIRNLQMATKKTAIYVTHDQSVAFSISDRIYLMQEGKIQQVGSPIELYRDPKTPFVAEFLGKNNFLLGKVVGIHPEKSIMDVNVKNFLVQVSYVEGFKLQSETVITVRPEDIYVTKKEEDRYKNTFEGKIERVTFTGATTFLEVDVGGMLIKVDVHGPDRFSYFNSAGKTMSFGFNEYNILK